MNTAEKVARLEEYLQRLQANAKLPHPRRAKPLRMDVAARAEPHVEAASPIADAAHAAVLELEAQRSAAERGANEAADRAAKEAAELAAQARALEQTAAREAAERAAKEAADKAAREKAAKDAAAKEAAEKAAAEKAAKDAAEKAAADKAAKDAAEKAAKEAAERAAKEKAAHEKAAHEKAAAEKAAAEKAAHEKAAAEKAAHEKAAAEKAAAEKAAHEKAAHERAAKEAADKAAKEKAAKDAAEKAAADKAAKEAAERAAKEKAAHEKAAHEKAAAEKAAHEKAAHEKAAHEKASKEKAAKEAAEKAAKERAAAAAPKRQPSTIDELFEDLELGGDTKVGPAELTPAASAALKPSPARAALTPSPSPARAAAPPLPEAVKDEPTFDAAEQPTVVADRSLLAQAAEAPTREHGPALPPDAPTRVAEAFPSVTEASTVEVPVVEEDGAGLDRSPEADEPTVIRLPSAHDQALARGELADEKSTGDEDPTIIRSVADEAPTLVAPKDEPIKAAPIIAVGEPSDGDAEDKAATSKSSAALHGPKVALAEPLREAAEREARERAEKAAQESALRPKRDPKERDEVTTASRRVVQLTPEAIEEERRKRDAEDKEKGKKKGWGTTVGLVAVTALLVGAAWFVGLREGWFSPGVQPSPSTSATQSGAGTKPTADGPRTTGVAPTGAPTSAQTVQPTATPTASVSAAPTAEPTAAPTVAPGTPAPPPVPVVTKDEASAKLNATKGFLTVTAPEDLSVFVTGRKIGQTNQRHELSCGVGLVRLGVSLPSGGIEWRSAPGFSIAIPCRASTTVAVPPSAGPWPTPGRAPAPGGGGDPY